MFFATDGLAVRDATASGPAAGQDRFERALAAFERLPAMAKMPCHHPHYVTVDALRDPRLSPEFFIFAEQGEIFYHAFHRQASGAGVDALLSPYGYGGPITTTADATFLGRAGQAWQAWKRAQGCREEMFRFHPLLENWRYHGGPLRDVRPTVWIDLTLADPQSGYRRERRWHIRKARQAPLTVEWRTAETFVAPFQTVYESRMRELDARDYYFFPEAYYRRLAEWEQARLAVCKWREEIVGAAIFLVQPGHAMEYHLAGTTPAGQRLSAASLLVHEAALLGQQLGCHALHLGGGTTDDPADPLFVFKRGFSSRISQYRASLPEAS